MTHLVSTRSGRLLEVWEYGDPTGHPALFFHGLIGSHHQASYIADEARRWGLRIIAPNRPGVGRSEFVARASPLEAVADVEDLARILNLERFSVIGISGGTPYALATLYRLSSRIVTTTILSGMGPMRLRGALQGMDARRKLFLLLGSRLPRIARKGFEKASARFQSNPRKFLERLVRTWSTPDQELFARPEVFNLFLRDLQEVFITGTGPQTLSQELVLYANYGFRLEDLPNHHPIILWHGLTDPIVPPAMAWEVVRRLPRREAHLVEGGHFVAIDIAPRITRRLREQLDEHA
jgi:pimeloyl-ACP methyl ester carboxylesterase